MNIDKQEVSGRVFRQAADYKAACKDAEMIDILKKRYHLSNENEIKQLLGEINSGKYRFRTILGNDFIEELQELQKEIVLKEKEKNNRKKKEKPSRLEKKHNLIKNTKKNDIKRDLSQYDQEMQSEIVKELKKQERIRKIIIIACSLVACGCIIYLSTYMYQIKRLDDYASTQQNLKGVTSNTKVTPETVTIHYNDEEIIVPDILPEYETLYSLNKKLIGWVKIDDTYIDYPVLQTINNEYYLNHNFDQEQDKNGSIFLDKDCRILPRTTNLILYGHHMRSGRMFGQLTKYSSEDFYKEHKYIQFDTIYEKNTYEVIYVFRSKIYAEDEIVFKYYQFTDANSETEFDSYMREMANMSLYDTGNTATFTDELLTLSTCDYYTDYGRFVVVAKKIK